MSDLLGGLPAPIHERAHEIRRTRGDLSLNEIAALASELHAPTTAAIADVAARLLCDRTWTSVADARTAARLILTPADSVTS